MGALGPDPQRSDAPKTPTDTDIGDTADAQVHVDAVEPTAPAGPVAVLDILDRDGQPRQTVSVARWPLQIGRALDNDVVLSDPHVAARHLRISAAARGLELQVGPTVNGVQLGPRLLRADERVTLPLPAAAMGSGRRSSDELGSRRKSGAASGALRHADAGIEFSLGRTRLRLRLAGHAVDEVALAVIAPLARRVAVLGVSAGLVVGGLLLRTWLDTDPDGFVRSAGTVLLFGVLTAALWCGAWALLSKTFSHQLRFGWHLRVFLLMSLALLAVDVLPSLGAFALSWPWLSNYSFVATIAVASTALYFHLLGVEPARRKVLKAVAGVCAGVAVSLSLWFNLQRDGQFGDELYMSHLFPPGVRLARPVAPALLIDGLGPLKALLDRKAREPGDSDE